jgi:hypothetical protein
MNRVLPGTLRARTQEALLQGFFVFIIHEFEDVLITTFEDRRTVGSQAVNTFDISRRIVLTAQGDR